MFIWQFEVLLTAFLYFSGAFNQTSTEWRTIYITPEDSNQSLVSCPVDYCYYLHDVLSNSSYFFHSHTTLELLPGMYNITEKVGQVVLSDVSNFTLKGSSPNATIITCLSGASLGITIVQSQNVEISNIQIRHCYAKLELKESNTEIHQTYDKLLNEISCTKYDSSSFYGNNSFLAFNFFLASFKNEKVTIYNTTILHSKGTGITSFDTRDLDVYKVRLAYNGVNCIIFVLDSTNTVITMTQSQINFGKSMSCSFASGLNLFLFVEEKLHNIYLANFMFTDNRGKHGNFLMVVHTWSSRSSRAVSYHLNISITNISSVQTSTASPGHGMVITYEIYLDLPDDLSNNIPEPLQNNNYVGYLLCNSDTYLWIFDSVRECYTWYQFGLSRRMTSLHNLWSKEVYIVLKNCSFIGSCVTIKDSKLWIKSFYVLTFVMENVTIRESRCPVAFSVVNSDLNNCIYLSDLNIYLSDLTIINSLNIILVNCSVALIISGNTSFLANQGSVSILNGEIKFKHFVLIYNNTAYEYESVFQISDSRTVSFEGEIMFINNTGRQGGAISAYNSNLYFNGNISFIDNSAGSGGAISLKEDAVIILQKDTHIILLANAAVMYGGGIFVEDASFWASRHFRCFIQINNIYRYNSYNYSIEFENNTAEIAGAALFGGWIDFCGTENSIKPSNILDFKAENSVASNPTRVCMCTNSTLNKFKTEARMDVFPGQTFEIEVVAVGQRFGMVPASIRAEAGIDVLGQFQKVQDTKHKCTKLKFTIRSSNKNETMLLNINGHVMPKWINKEVPDEFFQFKVFINLKGCPLGFEFDNRRNICLCQPYLGTHGVQCNFTVFKLSRNAQQWIGVLSPAKTVVVHQHCPYDYCKSYALLLNLSTPNDQCSFNRSGILCGACQPGLSQVLGTSNCKRCTNLSLLLIFVFAFAGMLLVAGLIKLNITVSIGTINGLIFYANIVGANTATFFPGKMANTFLRWFIAWLNLDVGIETCFYNGLDAYMKTWLQFTFPLYIWLLVTLIIISSKYSQRAARLFGVNAVHVLATLFLLSYAKLLRVTITVFQPTHLLNSHKIWHYDGNLAYLGKQHIILMIFASLFFVIFIIPYTLFLFGIQWLQIFSHYKPFCWVNKLKPLFDAYTGPYKDKHHYWTGLLLLVRIGLFIVFSSNTAGDPAINLLAIIIVVIGLFAYLAIFGGVYKIWLLNVLEYSSLINLIILCVTILYTISADKANHVLSQVSVSITLCTTVLVVAYHGLVVILKVVQIDSKVKAFCRNKEEPENTNQLQQCGNAVMNPPVTYSVIELTESLLQC